MIKEKSVWIKILFCRQLSESNSTQVTLQKVGFALSGNFSCEVSADAPSFSTAVYSTHMEVVGKNNIFSYKKIYKNAFVKCVS